MSPPEPSGDPMAPALDISDECVCDAGPAPEKAQVSAGSAALEDASAAAFESKCAAIVASVAAARSSAAALRAKDPEASADSAADARVAAMAAKRADIAAAVAAAKAADALLVAQEFEGSTESGLAGKKLTEKDLFGFEMKAFEARRAADGPRVKETRMQENFGQTKFIKP